MIHMKGYKRHNLLEKFIVNFLNVSYVYTKNPHPMVEKEFNFRRKMISASLPGYHWWLARISSPTPTYKSSFKYTSRNQVPATPHFYVRAAQFKLSVSVSKLLLRVKTNSIASLRSHVAKNQMMGILDREPCFAIL